MQVKLSFYVREAWCWPNTNETLISASLGSIFDFLSSTSGRTFQKVVSRKAESIFLLPWIPPKCHMTVSREATRVTFLFLIAEITDNRSPNKIQCYKTKKYYANISGLFFFISFSSFLSRC